MGTAAGDPAEDLIGACLDYCYKGDISSVVALLDKGLDVNSSDAVYTTPLQVASASGHEGIVQLLLSRSARPDLPNLYGWTPLMHAARHGHVGVVTLLLQRGADAHRTNRLGASSLTLAAVSGHLSTVAALLEASSPERAPGRLSPTLAAALHGNNSVLRLLLDRGQLGTALPDTGLSALMLAAVGGHRSTCRILLERGADPNARNTRSETALEMARVAGKRQTIRVLEDTTAEPDDAAADLGGTSSNLLDAVRRHDLRLAAQLLTSSEGSANQLASDGSAPLILAALDGDTEMAALLLRHGAAVNHQETGTGWTPLMHAVFHNQSAMVKLLLSSGADANLRAHNGCTAFDLASLVDSKPDMIRLLAACTYKYTPPVPPGLQGRPSAPMVWQTRAVSTPSLQDRGLKAWWNRMSSRFQNVKSRVEPVVALGVRPIPEEDSGDLNSREVPKLTLDSVLPASKRIKGWTAQGFPSRSLSSDTLRPVLPPFCCDHTAPDRRCLPPALRTPETLPPSVQGQQLHSQGGPPSGGHLNTFRLLRYLRSPNSSPSNSLGQRRLLSPGPHSSGDSGFETSGKSSADHQLFNKNKAQAHRAPNRTRPKPNKKAAPRGEASPARVGPVSDIPSCPSECSSVGKLTYLLRSLGLARYQPVFAEQEIDFEAFLDLTEADLKELDIGAKDSEKFAIVIRELRQKMRL